MYTLKVIFPAILTTRQHCLNKTSALHMELQYTLADSFCFGICNTQWGVLLSKQVNYNQVVMKCQILQECFLQNFKCKIFQNMEHSNSRTFKDPMNPVTVSVGWQLHTHNTWRYRPGAQLIWYKECNGWFVKPLSTDASEIQLQQSWSVSLSREQSINQTDCNVQPIHGVTHTYKKP